MRTQNEIGRALYGMADELVNNKENLTRGLIDSLINQLRHYARALQCTDSIESNPPMSQTEATPGQRTECNEKTDRDDRDAQPTGRRARGEHEI